MFRDVANKKNQISAQQCLDLLKQVPRGVLSLQGDEGYPYGLPTNFWYRPEDGCIYFHSGKQGHKVDSMARSPKASLCVLSPGTRKDGDWALSFESVIVFGTLEVLEDPAFAMETARQLSLQFTDDRDFIEHEIALYGSRTLCFRLRPEHITGKAIREA